MDEKKIELASKIWELKQKGYSIYKIAKTLSINNSIVSFVINYTQPYFYKNATKLEKIEKLEEKLKELQEENEGLREQNKLYMYLIIFYILFTSILFPTFIFPSINVISVKYFITVIVTLIIQFIIFMLIQKEKEEE